MKLIIYNFKIIDEIEILSIKYRAWDTLVEFKTMSHTYGDQSFSISAKLDTILNFFRNATYEDLFQKKGDK